MTLLDLLVAVRRRWATALGGFVLVLLASAAITASLPTTYSATATIGIVPGRSTTNLETFGQLASVAPLYAELARSNDIRERAQQLSDRQLGTVSVRTFRDTPLILKLDASARTAQSAQATAEAWVTALQEAVDEGAVLPADQVAIRVFAIPGVPSSPASPQIRLIALAAVLAGLLLGSVAAIWREGGAPR